MDPRVHLVIRESFNLTWQAANPDDPRILIDLFALMLRFMLWAFVVALGQQVIAFFYEWIMLTRSGQTWGKRVLKIKVVTADGRTRLGRAAAAKRASIYDLIPAIPLIGSVFSLVDNLWIFKGEDRQCLHDKGAKTAVIKA